MIDRHCIEADLVYQCINVYIRVTQMDILLKNIMTVMKHELDYIDVLIVMIIGGLLYIDFLSLSLSLFPKRARLQNIM